MINIHWIRFTFSPQYFNGIDSLLEIITVIVALLIAYYSYQLYKFSSDSKYKYFAWAFIAIFVAYIFKILTNVTIYYHIIDDVQLGRIELQFLSLRTSNLLYIIGYFLYRFLFFFGLLGIWFTIEKVYNRKLLLLLAWFMFVVAFVSHYAYFFFHITIFLLLAFITHSYFMNQQKVAPRTAKLVTLSFAMLMLSHVLFIFEIISLDFYVVGTLIQTIAFSILLSTYILVLKG
jgi:hypothetical protein